MNKMNLTSKFKTSSRTINTVALIQFPVIPSCCSAAQLYCEREALLYPYLNWRPSSHSEYSTSDCQFYPLMRFYMNITG